MTNTGSLYGKSLYDLAASEDLSEMIMEEMEAVQGLFTENPDYIRLLLEPSIPKKERLGLLDQAFGDAVHPYLLSFLKILTERGLLRDFRACEKCYRGLYNEAHGITEASVVSAVDLDPQRQEKLRKRLEEMSGKKVILNVRTDPQILGGIHVEMEGKLYDGTVRGRLSDLRRRLDETVL